MTKKSVSKGVTTKALKLQRAVSVYRSICKEYLTSRVSTHCNAVAVEGCIPAADDCKEWIRFRSQTEAAKVIGLKHDAIGVKRALTGEAKTAGGGWVFRYASAVPQVST